MFLRAFQLLLPALIPSWRFFDWIAPSPRIEFAVLPTSTSTPENWQRLTDRPDQLETTVALRRLFYNPEWNDQLYLVSCAERIAQAPDAHSIEQIFRRIEALLPSSTTDKYIRFRLVFVERNCGDTGNDNALISEIRYESEVRVIGATTAQSRTGASP